VPLFFYAGPKNSSIETHPILNPCDSAPGVMPTLLGEESSTILNVARGGFA